MTIFVTLFYSIGGTCIHGQAMSESLRPRLPAQCAQQGERRGNATVELQLNATHGSILKLAFTYFPASLSGSSHPFRVPTLPGTSRMVAVV